MSILFENQFGEIKHNLPSNMLEIYWKDSTEKLEDDDFQSFLLKFADLLQGYETSYFFVDATKKLFVMSNPIQEWHDKVIIPKYIESGIRKITFLIADNTMVDISLALTFDEENSQKLQTRFFGEENEARDWLEDKNVTVG